MAQPLSLRAALCTGAVMFVFGALATGDLPHWLDFVPMERQGTPTAMTRQSSASLQTSGGSASPSEAADSTAGGQLPELPPVQYPAVPGTAGDVRGFVPAEWSVLVSRLGDLNADGADDLALLLRMRDPANILAIPLGDRREQFDTNPHMLLVAFAQARGGYRLAASNRGLFPRPLSPWNGEEPLGEDTIRIENGTLLVFFGYLRGWASYRFRWQDESMRLIGYDSGGASGGCTETISINYLTGRARVEKGLISSERSRVVSRRLRSLDRPTLDAIDVETFIPALQIEGPPLLCPETNDG